MPDILAQLVQRMQDTYKDRLVSIVLYGSAATGEFHHKYSDYNVFCVLDRLTPKELAESEPILRWWREKGSPSPLLFARHEVATSTDCFPIEFHDMKERHRILHGEDVVAGLDIDDSFYRAQLEHELRAKLLRLRQKAAGVLSDKELLLRLLVDSISTFAVLARHALRIHGYEAFWQKREVFGQLEEKFGISAKPFHTILDLRDERIKPKQVDALALFEQYLVQIQALVDAVDRLEK